ncbi:hypothetical protein ALC62_13293 [Cyphomyrmex costatus]|uniref:Uncharacterized protein n=1 Tax=Cyphomyrmex costatus TaxID=456900 RepID=A0A151IAA8_9HYME|nr:hypothetical protein ALC62_13293 [Cyphomyrmex costatus]
MKNALLMFIGFMKRKGFTNIKYSMKEFHRCLAMPENKFLRSLFMDTFISADTLFEWISDLKETIKRQISMVSEAENRRFAFYEQLMCRVFLRAMQLLARSARGWSRLMAFYADDDQRPRTLGKGGEHSTPG